MPHLLLMRREDALHTVKVLCPKPADSVVLVLSEAVLVLVIAIA